MIYPYFEYNIFIHTHSCSLNTTIEMLKVATVPNTVMTVVIYHREFAYTESFIVQVSWDIQCIFHQNIIP